MKSSVVLSFFLIVGGAGCARSAPESTRLPSFEEFKKADTTSLDATPTCGGDCQTKRQEFRYVVYVGKKIYCYWDLKKNETHTDFDTLATNLEQQITDGGTDSNYYAVLRKWASAFHDGHVNVMASNSTYKLAIYTAPVRLQVLGPATDHEKVIVAQVSATTMSLSVSAGDEVVAINDVPIHQALDQAETIVSGSTQRMRRYFATHRLVDALAEDESGAVLKLTLNSAGKEKTVLIPREVELTPAPTGANGDDSATNDDSGLANFKATLLPNPNGSGMLGYLRIDAFAGTQSAYLLDQAMTRLNGTQGLILDLRKNGGGNMSGDAVLAHLAKAQTSLVRYTTSERMDNFILSQRPENFFLQWTQGTDFADWHDLTVDGSGEYFGKPVVALTSPNCFSACDTFSAGLKANGLATMIGEGTGGGTGTPLVFTLPSSGMQFRYGVVRGRTAKGDTIEGAGTLPDIVSEPTVADFVKNEDSQLNLALSVLISKITGKPPVPTTGPIPALAGMTPIHQQSLDVSPTRSAENDLERILKVDELAP